MEIAFILKPKTITIGALFLSTFACSPTIASAQTPTCRNAYGSVTEVALGRGRAYIRRGQHPIIEISAPEVIICESDRVYAQSGAEIKIRINTTGQIQTLSNASWQVPLTRQFSWFERMLPPFKEIVFAGLTSAPRTQSARQGLGVPYIPLPGVCSGDAQVWKSDLSSSIEVPLMNATNLKTVEARYREGQLRTPLRTKLAGDTVTIFGLSEAGTYELMGSYHDRPNRAQKAPVYLGSFQLNNDQAAWFPNRTEIDERLDPATANILRAAYLLNQNQSRFGLMSYQLVNNAGLELSAQRNTKRELLNLTSSTTTTWPCGQN
jgi:hypothetical protein